MRPSASADHIASRSASVRARAGGVNLRKAPWSRTSPSRSVRYCGQLSTTRPSAASSAAGWLTCAATTRAPVRRASKAVRPSAVSSASRVRQSGTIPPSSRPDARRRASASAVSASSSAWTRHTAPTEATDANNAPSSSAVNPCSPCVVHVNALTNATPARHTPAISSCRPGHACAASPKSIRERSRRYARLRSRSSAVITGSACVCSISVVTPARAAAAVPVGKSSRLGSAGSIRWTCASTMPGNTRRPDASTRSRASHRSGPTDATRPSATYTCPRLTPPGVTTSPPSMPRS